MMQVEVKSGTMTKDEIQYYICLLYTSDAADDNTAV